MKEAPLAHVSGLRIKLQDLEKELAAGQLDLTFDVWLPLSSQPRSQKLMEDDWFVVGRQDHPRLQGPLSLEDDLSERHIVVSSRRAGLSMKDFELPAAWLSPDHRHALPAPLGSGAHKRPRLIFF